MNEEHDERDDLLKWGPSLWAMNHSSSYEEYMELMTKLQLGLDKIQTMTEEG